MAAQVRLDESPASGNHFLRDWQLERFAIELKLANLLQQELKTGIFPIAIQPGDTAHYELYGFVAGVVRMYERLSPRGQNRLRGMLVDGLKPDNSLLSLQHEV